ncbi:MAG TPA: hypothetical protein PK765_06035 [bacterium]|nr:hypothetical protein [bacterium]
MAPDSLRFFQNAPDAPKKDADASPKVDLSEFERRYRSLKDMAARGELKDTLGTILATRDAGQCLRTGQWYVESVQDGVWLSPIGTENLGVSRPKTFVSYFELEHSIDDLLTSLAVPSNGLDSLRAGTPARDSAKDDAGTTSSDAPTDANRDNTEAPQDPEAVARAERLAKLLMDYPDAHRFYSFGELVSPSKREVESIVRPENFLQIREHPRSEFVREVSKDARYTPESAKERIVEETRRLDRQIDRAGER